MKSFLKKRIDSKYHAIALSAFFALMMKSIAAVSAVVINILFARVLGASGAGLYFMALSIVSAAVMFSRFGIDLACVRYVAPMADLNDWEGVAGATSVSLVVVLFWSLLSVGGIYLCADFISEWWYKSYDLSPVLHVMIFSVVPIAMIFLISQLFRANHQVFVSQALCFALPSLGTLGVFLVFWVSNGDNISVIDAASSYLLSSIVIGSVALYLWADRISGFRIFFHWKGAKKHFFKLLQISHSLFLGLLSEYFMAWGPILLVGYYMDDSMVGIFSIALRLSIVVSFIVSPVGIVIGPRIAVAYQKNNLELTRMLISKSNRLLLLISIPFAILAALSAPYVLGVFGEEFIVGVSAFILLVLGEIFQMATGNTILFLNMTKYEKAARDFRLLGVGLMTVLGVVLIPEYGILGMAIGVVCGQISKNILAFWYVRRKFGFWAI